MPGIKITTDMGDWTTLPLRMRLAIVTFVAVLFAVAGIGLTTGVLSLSASLVLGFILLIAWTATFDRRRPWWPEEPTLPVDPIGLNLGRKLRLWGALIVAVVLLALAGVLPR